MSSDTYDVVVAGLGAMGSAAACHLARRGRRVLGLDRFSPPHARGSSAGRTRIIREAYFENPAYVPLVQRAYELWDALAADTGRTLRLATGGLMIGNPEGALVTGAYASARIHALAHEVLEPAEIARRFPALAPGPTDVAIWEPRAGVLFPEACIAAHLEQAASAGAELVVDEPVLSWSAGAGQVEVRTAAGRYRAAHLIVAAGAWAREFLPRLDLPLVVQRQTLFWFRPAAHAAHFLPERFPIFIWEDEPGRFIYGFPELGDGVKIARHQEGETTDPDAVRREVPDAEAEPLRAVIRRLIPDADGPLLEREVCLYTNTPDGHFVLDVHPEHPEVLIASPCSGHGFKFASALGEVMADLVTGAKPRFDLELFGLARLLGPAAPGAHPRP